mgnify:CR=1 FL=1
MLHWQCGSEDEGCHPVQREQVLPNMSCPADRACMGQCCCLPSTKSVFHPPIRGYLRRSSIVVCMPTVQM